MPWDLRPDAPSRTVDGVRRRSSRSGSAIACRSTRGRSTARRFRVLESANMPAVLDRDGVPHQPGSGEAARRGDEFQNAFVQAITDAIIRFRDARSPGRAATASPMTSARARSWHRAVLVTVVALLVAAAASCSAVPGRAASTARGDDTRERAGGGAGRSRPEDQGAPVLRLR